MRTITKLAPSNCPEQTDARGRFITTYSGAKFYINELNIEDVPIEDVAHALSMNCRFNGHLETFYSVAEHSVLVSRMVPKRYRLQALLHDISEAFIPDIPRPFKEMLPGFDEYEEQILVKASEHYGFEYPLSYTTRYVDKHIVRAEAIALMKQVPDWVYSYEDILSPDDRDNMIFGLAPPLAAEIFMEEFALCLVDKATEGLDYDSNT